MIQDAKERVIELELERDQLIAEKEKLQQQLVEMREEAKRHEEWRTLWFNKLEEYKGSKRSD